MFCDEQYDCVNPVLCADASALNKRATSATSIFKRLGLVVDAIAAMCEILWVAVAGKRALSNDCGSSERFPVDAICS